MRAVNFLRESLIKSLTNVQNNGIAQRCYQDAQQRFVIFHVLNYIMYTEALNAFDEMEECGLMRHEVKRYRNICESEWARYQKTSRKAMTDDAWYLLQDLCMNSHASIEEDIARMRQSFYDYLHTNNNSANAEVISYLSVSLKISDLIVSLWRAFFATYKRICGLDFTNDFEYADMRVFVYYLKAISESLAHGNGDVDFGLDKKCADAMAAIENKIADDKFLDDAARIALNYSKKYKKLLNS